MTCRLISDDYSRGLHTGVLDVSRYFDVMYQYRFNDEAQFYKTLRLFCMSASGSVCFQQRPIYTIMNGESIKIALVGMNSLDAMAFKLMHGDCSLVTSWASGISFTLYVK